MQKICQNVINKSLRCDLCPIGAPNGVHFELGAGILNKELAPSGAKSRQNYFYVISRYIPFHTIAFPRPSVGYFLKYLQIMAKLEINA
jgi:hypothetical protein